jgi:plasmid stabilization system protein ParE
VNYSVIWQPTAESMLADVWNHASDRNAVTRAANQIDARLANDPTNEGESRGNSLRITFEQPLVVYFRVIENAKQVRVLFVKANRSA